MGAKGTKKIMIMKCKDSKDWYKDYVSHKFDVVRESTNCYYVKYKTIGSMEAPVLKEDVEVI